MTPSNRDTSKSRLPSDLRVLGETLKELRKKAGLSVRALAREAGYSPTIILRIEPTEEGEIRIKRWPSEEQLNKLADALGHHSDEFRQRVGIVRPESQAILTTSPAFASTLESIHERFVGMLKDKGLTRKQIERVMAQATEQTILDVVNGREPIDVDYGRDTAALVAKHRSAGYQILDINAGQKASSEGKEMDSASSYLERNKGEFLPNDLSRPTATKPWRDGLNRPTVIAAGAASIVLSREISDEERTSLLAIAAVIKELLDGKASRGESK